MENNTTVVLAWLVACAAIVGPTIYRLLRRAYLIRQHKKNLPGPLLGVAYPKDHK
jgi:hypothetical protein